MSVPKAGGGWGGVTPNPQFPATLGAVWCAYPVLWFWLGMRLVCMALNHLLSSLVLAALTMAVAAQPLSLQWQILNKLGYLRDAVHIVYTMAKADDAMQTLFQVRISTLPSGNDL